MTTAFERLSACTPVNRQAARAIRPGSVEVPPTRDGGCLHWSAPPKIRPVPPQKQDLTGHQFGRLTVVGLMAEMETGKTRWLVRCTCGDYETRNTGVVLRANPRDSCCACNLQESIRFRGMVTQYGVKVAERIQQEERDRQCEAAGVRSLAVVPRRATGNVESIPRPAVAQPRPSLRVSPKASVVPAPVARVVPQNVTSRVASVAHEAMKASIRGFVATGIKGIDLANRMEAKHPNSRDLATHLLRGLVAEGEVVEVECFVPDALQQGGAYVGSFYLPAGGRMVQATESPARKRAASA